ncbi:hypothetical protein G7Y89_g68 [Cudoniella acicularis]|uniref:ATP-dependent DNA helicase n=1 Tax=Cudoniella acicularis TaxID=354080 RepID=A0A8H4RY05_9HELO|nr:hypothetical protein G7Y89_g68 [Cudoniella acicularis]
MDDEDEYGDIADEDLIEAFSQASQTLPPLSRSPEHHPNKRRRLSYGTDDDTARRRSSRNSMECSGSGGDEEENASSKKKKYKIHIGADEVPRAVILGATQADAHPDSSPYRIRGPIYRKPRPDSPTTPRPPKPPLFSAARRSIATPTASNQRASKPAENNDFARELEDLPSDTFSSPENNGARGTIMIGSSPVRNTQASLMPRQRLVAPQNGLRQTTLFGGRAQQEVSASQAKKVHNFIVDLPPEAPTHHVLNQEELETWVYPTNLGTIRDYQFSIVRNGLFNNLLVALPTGLGKTFIAATIMLNYFRWTKDAQIVFVAPTKPLVAQQAEACFNTVGIPKSQTTMLTGEQAPALRAEEWAEKRVFFMTPQTLENDLSHGIADPKKVVLLVVDEAHRATGNYAYVKVVKFIRRFNTSFRVLALTATPGANVEAVQEVVDGLEISKVEIRTEESIDIQQYVHRRNIDQIVLDPSDDMIMIKELFAKALQPLVNQLCAQNAYWTKDPMALTPFGLLQAKKAWFASDAGRRASLPMKGMMNGLFTILASVAHGIKLLNFHGIGPFFSSIKEFRQGVEDGYKGGKYRKQIVDNPDFKKMMDRMQAWINKDDFVGHPKLTYLCDTILNHFMDAGEGRLGADAPPSSTRVIVFAEYRDSAEDICRVLNRHGPMVRASVFVGQADSKRSEGMNQGKQLETIKGFKSGKFNVIVATSIGEEGLDIGQVDLIVCYDASASPIRMLQRMGRTGRKRAGNIVLLLMRGKEQDSFTKAKDNYEEMQKMISSGARFNFRHDLSVRIIPRDINPVVDKRLIEIPIENTQDPSLPLPKRRRTTKKMPPKKFHMPDGVETGFCKASKLSGDGTKDLTSFGAIIKESKAKQPEVAPVPSLHTVLLSPEETGRLERLYQNVVGNEMQEVSMPEMTSQPVAQRSLSHTVKIPHGQYTTRCVKLFKILAKSQRKEDRFVMPFGNTEPSREFFRQPPLINDGIKAVKNAAKSKKPTVPKPKRAKKASLVLSDAESVELSPRGRPGLSSAVSPDSEGEGNDLANSEEASEDSESEGSLQDFIAGDEGTSSIRGPVLTRSLSPPPRIDPKRKKSFDSSSIAQESSDDLPDIADLAGVPSKRVPEVFELSTDEERISRIDKRAKRRRVVEEDDSDE